MIKLNKKLQDRHGATLIMALMLVLVAVVVSFIVIQAATSSSLVAGSKNAFSSSTGSGGEGGTEDVSVSFSKSSYEYTYDGTAHGDEITPVVTQNGATLSGVTIKYSTNGGQSWSTTKPTLVNVNTLNVRVQVSQGGRVISTGNGYTLKVSPRTVTVTANDMSGVEEGTDVSKLSYTATVSNNISDDGYTLAYSLTVEPVTDNAYEYKIVPSGSALQGNYAVNYVPGTLTIKKTQTNALTVSLNNMDFSGTYTGEAQKSDGSVTVKLNDVALTNDYTLTYSYQKNGEAAYSDKEAPTVTNVSEIPSGGLVVTVTARYKDMEASTSYTMKLEQSNAWKFIEYDSNTLKYAYTGSAQQGGIKGIEGYLLAADAYNTSVTYSYGTVSDSATAPSLTAKDSSCVVTAKATNPNYQTKTYQYTFSIGLKTGLTLTAPSNCTATYSGSALSPAPTASGATSGTTAIWYRTSADNTSWSDWTTTKPSLTNAGTLYVQAQAKNSDYDDSNICEYTLTVNRKEVTVKADNLRVFSRNSIPTSYTATVTGLLDSDTVNYSCTCDTSKTNQSSYTIVASGVETQGNYTVSYTNGTLTVQAPTKQEAQDSVDAVRDYIKANIGTLTYTLNSTKYTARSTGVPDDKKPYICATYKTEKVNGQDQTTTKSENFDLDKDGDFYITDKNDTNCYRITDSDIRNSSYAFESSTYKVTVPEKMKIFEEAITKVLNETSESETVIVPYNNSTITGMKTNVYVTFALDSDNDLSIDFVADGYGNQNTYYGFWYKRSGNTQSTYTKDAETTTYTSFKKQSGGSWSSTDKIESGAVHWTKVEQTGTYTFSYLRTK